MTTSALRRAGENLVKNWMTTVPTILSIAVVISLFHVLSIVRIKTRDTVNDLQKRVSITAYVRPDADAFAISKLITQLEARSDVTKPVVYKSKEDAQKSMNQSLNLNADFLERYSFNFPASIRITPTSAAAAPQIQAFLATAGREILDDGVQAQGAKKLTNDVITFIQSIEQSVFNTLIFFIGLFTVGSLLLIAVTTKLSFERHRATIGIMKLLGATDDSITLPLLFEGAILALLSFLVHVIFTLLVPFGGVSAATYGNLLLGEACVTLGVVLLTTFVLCKTQK